MKKLFLSLALSFVAQSSQALEIQVAPLALSAKVKAVGITAAVDGRGLILVAGDAARVVAGAAGFAIDTSAEMLILAGDEVDEVLWTATEATLEAGTLALVETYHVARFAERTALDLIYTGKAVVLKAGKGVFGHNPDQVFEAIGTVITKPIFLVRDTGLFALKTGRHIVRGTLHILGRIIGF